jgi:tetratricopeptide (TPR) repeat protein
MVFGDRGVKGTRRPPVWWLSPTLLLIVAVGVAFRVWSLQQTPYGYDEIMQARVTLGGLADVADVARGHYGASPLDYYLCWAAHRLFQHDAALRLPALLWGALSIFAAWRLARSLVGRHGAALAALLVALSPFLIHASHLVRWYSALVFFSLAIPAAGLAFLRRPSPRTGVAFSLIAALGLLEHPFAGLCLAAFGLASVLAWLLALLRRGLGGRPPHRLDFIRLLTLAGIMALAALPLLLWIVYSRGGGESPFKPPDWGWELFSRPYEMFMAGLLFHQRAFLTLGILGALVLLWRRPWAGFHIILLLATWPLLIWVAIERDYIFYARHIIFILPWILIAVAVALATLLHLLLRRAPSQARVVTTAALALALALPAAVRAPDSDWDFGDRVPVMEIGDFIQRNFRPDTHFILPDFLYNPLQWFAQRLPGLDRHLWRTDGPPEGPDDLEYPLRVFWISEFPTRAWFEGDALQIDDLYISEGFYRTREELHPLLFDFAFQSFATSHAARKHAMQSNFQRLAQRWGADTSQWLHDGPRTHDEYTQASALCVRAQPILRDRDYRQAYEILAEAYALDPYSVHSLGGLAFVHRQLGQDDRATEAWEELLTMAPFFQAHLNLAQLNLKADRPDQAVQNAANLVRFPEVEPGHFDFYASLLQAVGRPRQAASVPLLRRIHEQTHPPPEDVEP